MPDQTDMYFKCDVHQHEKWMKIQKMSCRHYVTRNLYFFSCFSDKQTSFLVGLTRKQYHNGQATSYYIQIMLICFVTNDVFVFLKIRYEAYFIVGRFLAIGK